MTTHYSTVGEAIVAFRDSERALRKIAKNGGRTAASTNAAERHDAIVRHAEVQLLDSGHRELAGQLTEEASLALRIAESKANGIARPELQGHLDVARIDIRRYLRLNGWKSLL